MEEQIPAPSPIESLEDIPSNPRSDRAEKILLSVFILIGFFMFIIAAKTVFASISPEGNAILDLANYSGNELTLNVAIPCSGHAGLIVLEVKKLEGVDDVKFKGSGIFEVFYDPAKTSKEEILSLEVFQSYPAKVIKENTK